MARPSAYPRWADVSGDIVEPTSGKKDVGWVAGEKPPAQYFNWILKNIYDWVVHFDRGSQVAWLPASMARVVNNTSGLTTAGAAVGAASRIQSTNGFATGYEFPLHFLREGDRITAITLYGREGNAGGETYTGVLESVNPTTSATTSITATKTSGTTNADTNLAWTTADSGLSTDGYVVPANTPLIFRGVMAATSSDNEVHVHMLKLTYDKASL